MAEKALQEIVTERAFGESVLTILPALKSGKALDALEFLEAFKSDPASLDLGTDVVVVGGGNTAMDVARAAKRVPGVKNVRLAYRRTSRYMPADEEELTMALADGVEFLELLAPDTLENGVLTCDVMELGEPDASGRRGPATVVKAIADAQVVARAIANASFDAQEASNIAAEVAKVFSQRGNLCADCASTDKTRCLSCAAVCETCVEVCPNRANVAVRVPGMRQAQIVHVDGMCNECGNCAVFCPYGEGRPYKDKFTLFWSREDFDSSTNEGFLPEGELFRVRLDGAEHVYNVNDTSCGLPEDIRRLIVAVREHYSYLMA